MATGIRRRLRRSVNDCRGFLGAWKRHAATVDTFRGTATESRCNLRARRVGARLRGRGRANGTFQSLSARGGRRKREKRASFRLGPFGSFAGVHLDSRSYVRISIFSSVFFFLFVSKDYVSYFVNICTKYRGIILKRLRMFMQIV